MNSAIYIDSAILCRSVGGVNRQGKLGELCATRPLSCRDASGPGRLGGATRAVGESATKGRCPSPRRRGQSRLGPAFRVHASATQSKRIDRARRRPCAGERGSPPRRARGQDGAMEGWGTVRAMGGGVDSEGILPQSVANIRCSWRRCCTRHKGHREPRSSWSTRRRRHRAVGRLSDEVVEDQDARGGNARQRVVIGQEGVDPAACATATWSASGVRNPYSARSAVARAATWASMGTSWR